MVAFDATGTVLWSAPNEQPMIATADNGVIGTHGTIYDQFGTPTGTSPLKDYTDYDANGNVTAQATVVQSWRGNVYSGNSGLNEFAVPSIIWAQSLTGQEGGGNKNGTTARRNHSRADL
jgi:hypothetical protein